MRTANADSVSTNDGVQSIPIATALRKVLRRGYTKEQLRADLLAGTVVGIVALPLSMALAIAVGAPPQHGLYTAVVAGAATAALGGCKFQVTGPTAAFIVILAPILTQYGLGGLLTAGFLAGIMLVGLGLARLGNLIRFIPYPVTTGFTTGIAVVIATLQLKDVFGLQMAPMPEHYHEKLHALWSARGTASLAEFGIAAGTFALLLLVPRVLKRIPAPLVAIIGGAVFAQLLAAVLPGFEVATIGSRFTSVVDGVEVHGIPRVPPLPALPWTGMSLDFDTIRELLPAAFAIALLGAIESLLSGVIADGMTGTRHDSNAELVGVGIGNIVAPLFGGIAATGALARTATNIRAGAVSPVAAMWHSVIVLLAILVAAPLVAYIPMASLAALLLLVAWNMSEIRHFLGLLRIAPKSDIAVLLICFGLTVFFDMVWAVSVGFVLANVLFMRRMAAITESSLAMEGGREEPGLPLLPRGVALYQINGPLFFGAAQNAMDALGASHSDSFHTIILYLGRVPVIDATGFAALESTLNGLIKHGKRVVLAGPFPRPQAIWDRARIEERLPQVVISATLDEAVTEVGGVHRPSPPNKIISLIPR